MSTGNSLKKYGTRFIKIQEFSKIFGQIFSDISEIQKLIWNFDKILMIMEIL